MLAGVVALSILEDRRYEEILKSQVDRVIAVDTARRERLAARGGALRLCVQSVCRCRGLHRRLRVVVCAGQVVESFSRERSA